MLNRTVNTPPRAHFFLKKKFFTFGQVKSDARRGRSRHQPTNQSFRVRKLNLATLKVAIKSTSIPSHVLFKTSVESLAPNSLH